MADIKKPTHTISKNTFFLSLALMAVVAFAAGTHSQDIAATIGPVLGFKVPHGQIDLSSVQKTYQQLNTNFDGKLNTQKLIDGANEGLVSAAGDKFTDYFTAAQAKSFNDDLTGNVGAGIGAQIATRNDQPTIVTVLPDNPAQRAGVQDGDIITAVNGKSSDKESADKVATAVRGSVGSTVKLTISRNGQPMTFTITRATINDPSVLSSVSNGIGKMTISRFDSQTGDLARKAAEQFKSQNVKGVILDLRDDGGGVVDSAQQVASIWLNNKTVVTERTNGKVTNTLTADSDPVLAGIPTVVLVNANTASASEIVSAALRDNKAATLVGEKTYGKGTMQQIIDLGQGAQLKVTVAHWYTPNGVSIEYKGLIPSKIVGLTKEDASAGRDPQLAAGLQLLSSEIK